MAEDKISAGAITRDLKTRFVGRRVLYYPVLTSTMEVARQEAERGAAEGTVVIADEQTAGRGRLKRPWLSPRGNIALSVILYPDLPRLPQLTMLASLAVAHSIEATTGLKAAIKWPNDVLVSGKKVSGILLESNVKGSTANHAIIGIGINVNLPPLDFPEITPTATGLADELGKKVSRLAVIQRLLVEIEQLYLTLSAGESLYEKWRDSLVTLGEKVRVSTGDNIYEGVAESVDRDGSLLVRQADGRLHRFVAADVTLHG